MDKQKLWIKQGRYKSEDGTKMILVLDPKTGATILEPLVPKKPECDGKHVSVRAICECGDCVRLLDSMETK